MKLLNIIHGIRRYYSRKSESMSGHYINCYIDYADFCCCLMHKKKAKQMEFPAPSPNKFTNKIFYRKNMRPVFVSFSLFPKIFCEGVGLMS